ncbi:hypothetical protein AAG570_014092 [Ranatra chinensis]|uniref:Uncharacterized protein n=1 Tax=Ranatra chinensis TaxID=642074 RepID=A0ABD0Y5G0_9HEMI
MCPRVANCADLKVAERPLPRAILRRVCACRGSKRAILAVDNGWPFCGVHAHLLLGQWTGCSAHGTIQRQQFYNMAWTRCYIGLPSCPSFPSGPNTWVTLSPPPRMSAGVYPICAPSMYNAVPFDCGPSPLWGTPEMLGVFLLDGAGHVSLSH